MSDPFNREAIAVALFNLLQTMGNTFAGYSRRPQLWDEAPAYPYLYMGNTREEVQYSSGNTALPLNLLSFPITLYGKDALDPNVTPDTIINNWLTAVDTALLPPPVPPNQVTLGGLVAYVRREGEVIRIPGYLDGQMGVYFTIKALVPA